MRAFAATPNTARHLAVGGLGLVNGVDSEQGFCRTFCTEWRSPFFIYPLFTLFTLFTYKRGEGLKEWLPPGGLPGRRSARSLWLAAPYSNDTRSGTPACPGLSHHRTAEPFTGSDDPPSSRLSRGLASHQTGAVRPLK